MLIGRIEQLAGTVVHVIGKSQGYIGLPVRWENMWDNASGDIVSTMTTAWFPDPKELERINAGEAIHCRLFGDKHPPIYIGVGGADPHEQDGLRAAARRVCTILETYTESDSGGDLTLGDLARALADLAGALDK